MQKVGNAGAQRSGDEASDGAQKIRREVDRRVARVEVCAALADWQGYGREKREHRDDRGNKTVDNDKPYGKSLVMRKDSDGNEIRRELQQDSTGVREFFAWAVQIFRVVYENRVVFADEMDRVLNPILSDRVVAFINGEEHKGQFVFSTHNVLHLNLKTYMKEQIYFVTKSKDSLTSELYSLSDFPEVRYETAKVYEFYMKGILGGTAFE